MRAWPGLRVPEAREQLGLRRGGDQVELVGQDARPGARGQGRDPAVGVEDRGQREDVRDGRRRRPSDRRDRALDRPRARRAVLASSVGPGGTGTTSSTRPIPPSRDSTVW